MTKSFCQDWFCLFPSGINYSVLRPFLQFCYSLPLPFGSWKELVCFKCYLNITWQGLPNYYLTSVTWLLLDKCYLIIIWKLLPDHYWRSVTWLTWQVWPYNLRTVTWQVPPDYYMRSVTLLLFDKSYLIITWQVLSDFTWKVQPDY